METKEILKSLKLLIDKGIRISDIENTIGMPKNNLSSILKEKRVMPKKWIQPLEGYIENGKRKKIILVEGENGNWICDGKKVKLIWEDDLFFSKPIKKLEQTMPKVNVIEYTAITKDCYDGKKFDKLDLDEAGQYENVPRETNEEIRKKIADVDLEIKPSIISKFNFERYKEKKKNELRKQLK